MLSSQDKVLNGMERLCHAAGLSFTVEFDRNNSGVWIIKFTAGNVAAVQCSLETFLRAPRIVLEPFGEEIIKQTCK